MEIFNRSEMVIGRENINRLQDSSVLVFGLGGVGGSLCEALIRAGIGKIGIVDRDIVDVTNINRQVIATQNTVGMKKTDAMYDRLISINPVVKIEKYHINLNEDTISRFNFSNYDYIADAIDTVSAKILLAKICYENNHKLISAMGTGNKINPAMLEVSDIKKTSVCPLARVMRRELKNRGIEKLKVVYSREEPINTKFKLEKASTPGSMSFVPPVCGIIMASEIVKELIVL
ncbi:tRNA threonylcarbamoyladenosine dehydratase [Peptoniphilus mikwangii]|uniref:tRNA threonylcarbamoyladenosine dehydratase n=1 Tax=Peptoniphilus mikwangii TaxID=1354300 RepID=UPI000405D31B|nr:tRNA threonylcarbamoyladenosine dehydratase [Peptoniphilus mikwangii]